MRVLIGEADQNEPLNLEKLPPVKNPSSATAQWEILLRKRSQLHFSDVYLKIFNIIDSIYFFKI